MDIRFLAQRLDCLPCWSLQARSENGFVLIPIIFGYLSKRLQLRSTCTNGVSGRDRAFMVLMEDPSVRHTEFSLATVVRFRRVAPTPWSLTSRLRIQSRSKVSLDSWG